MKPLPFSSLPGEGTELSISSKIQLRVSANASGRRHTRAKITCMLWELRGTGQMERSNRSVEEPDVHGELGRDEPT